MLTVGDALVKALAKSQKVTFWSQKNNFKCFFFLLFTAYALRLENFFDLWMNYYGCFDKYEKKKENGRE